MPETELKILNDKLDKFIEETRRNFGSVEDSLNTFENKHEDIYRKLGAIENEFHLLKQGVNNQTKTFSRKTDEIKDHIDGGTKVIVKEVDKAKKRWYQFWVKNKNGKD